MAQREPGFDAVLADGRIVRIRPVRREDAEALRALHRRASDESIYLRFFGMDRAGAERYVENLPSDQDPPHALLAILDGSVVAVASHHPTGQTGEAEVAFFVDDRYQHIGIGTLLLEHLAVLARRAGVHRFVAETLAKNALMRHVLTRSGFHCEQRLEDGVITVTMDTVPDESVLQAIEERERRSDVASLEPLLRPGSVAVVGASRQPGTVGHEVFSNIARGGFTRPVFPVNRADGSVAGLEAYRSLREVPERVDLAVITVPSAGVLDAVKECADHGVRAVVIISAGFAELGEAGAAAQREIVRVARQHGIRIVGPNCLGVVNTDPAIALDATFIRGRPRPGRVGFLSQSGALGIAVLEHAGRLDLGLSAFVSVGNKADVSGNDLLLFWEKDPHTDVIALYLESFGNPRKFARIARRVCRSKPVIAVKGGRSGGGRRAAASHTAAAMASEEVVDALFHQTGVIRVSSLEELLDTARLLVGQPLPTGGRLGIIGNAGGAGVLAADAATNAGLEIPSLDGPGLRGVLQEAIPGAATATNPVDLGAAAGPGEFSQAMSALLGSGEVDCLHVVFTATLVGDTEGVIAAISRTAADHPDIPVVATVLGSDTPPTVLDAATPDAAPVPVYNFPESAVRALGHVARYARWGRRPIGQLLRPAGINERRAQEIAQDYLEDRPEGGGGWLPFPTAVSILNGYGIPVVSSLPVDSPDTAAASAERLGYPVALKADVPDMVHKSDRGGVRLGLADVVAVREAYTAMRAHIGSAMRGAIVQRMMGTGIELIVGAVHEPSFGPVLMTGFGGVHTDLLADRAFRLLPLTDVDAAEMIRSLRFSPLLFGYRRSERVDVSALEDLLARVAALASDLPQLAELDLNPVLATTQEVTVLDVKMRLAPTPTEPEPWLRRLR